MKYPPNLNYDGKNISGIGPNMLLFVIFAVDYSYGGHCSHFLFRLEKAIGPIGNQ